MNESSASTAAAAGASPIVLLGVDAGGSHTAAAIARPDLRVLARAEGGGAPMRTGAAAATAAAVAEVTKRAAQSAGVTLPIDRAVVGAAGAGRALERGELRQALFAYGLARDLEVVADGEIALAAAFGTAPGILVNAGTGSIAYARDREGRLRRAGGYGWQLGDEGGGYWIGRRALASAARARDAAGPGSELLARVLGALKLREFDDLVRWAAGAAPVQVAGLASLVLVAARDGEATAVAIVTEAAAALAQLVTMVERMFPPDDPLPVAVAGGLLRAGSPLLQALAAELGRRLPRVRLRDAAVDAPVGALQLARALP